MTEHWFYHLEHATVESVLPMLLEKSLERDWRCLVKTTPDTLSYYNDFLWSFRDDSFLPHSRDDEPLADLNPVILSANADVAKGVDVVILLGGQDIENFNGVTRCMFMINGKNAEDVQNARARWARLKKFGADLSYYQQDDRGRWQKKA